MAVTAALALTATPTHASAVPDIRVIRAVPGAPPPPRFVLLRYDAVVLGIHGTDDVVVDRATGRFVDHTKAGPASSWDGYDGVRAWAGDATGLAEVADQADDRSMILATAYLLAGPPRVVPHVVRLSSNARYVTDRLRYPALSRSFDVRIDRATGRLVSAELRAQSSHTTLTVEAYRTIGSLVVPAAIRSHSDFGDMHETLRSVAFTAHVVSEAFSAPRPPNDTTLMGITTVPLAMYPDGPVVTIRVDDGPPLRVLVDTGSGYTLSASAARRSKLRLFGSATSGGVGPHLVPVRLATAKRVRIGGAVLRDQPIEVLADRDLADGGRTDGLIGYELFARLAARIDLRLRRMQLARRVSSLHPRGARIPIVLEGGQPQVDGEIDGLRGAITIDTGSTYGLDVTSPAVRAHDLLRRYKAKVFELGGGIGGSLPDYRAHARTVRLGRVVVHDVPLALDLANGGAMDDPSTIGNAGLPLLRRFVIVFDYRGRAMYLDPVR
ncbi:MAG TPA: pepsin/retropepsin-like aspartic protease family protein [Candidatus Elarobacter sp.]|nr:pepsin/retropepsin-like aspartic protease family protein [Candidatus Elarobacter sp.]